MKTTITCATDGCSNSFEWENLPGFETPEGLLCDECERKREEDHKAALAAEETETIADSRQAALRNLHDATPPRYRDTRLDHPEWNSGLWDEVKNWRPTKERPWIGIVGAKSGDCKTRVAFLLAKIILSERSDKFGFEAITSYDFKRLALAQYGRGTDEEDSPRNQLARLASCDTLLLDDIGKAKHTPAVAEEIFTIIDHRYANLKPIIWTSNCHPDEFASDIADKELAGPLVGRILECSLIIDLDP